ncbi:hypothetical protein [Candidatus Poriferisodalis sp.]|uniref:hypothetical protein n=1 Tax=Candidatus Poriferisodalis sp. TaxID=3101277 RepID=UPI003AF91715
MSDDRFGVAERRSRDRMYAAARSVEKEADEIRKGIGIEAKKALDEMVSETRSDLAGLDNEIATAIEAAGANRARSKELLESIEEVHRISTETALGGSHSDTAHAEGELAAQWHERSIRYRWAAVAAAVATTALNVVSPAEGWEWAFRSPAGAGVAILIWMSKYASDQGEQHRVAGLIFRHQALAFLALGRFAQNMADESVVGEHDSDAVNPSQQFLLDVAKPLFTEQIDALVERSKVRTRRTLRWRRSDGESALAADTD